MKITSDYHHTQPSASDLRIARMTARLSTEEAARFGGIPLSEYEKQEQGCVEVSLSLYYALLCKGGYIIDEDWGDWRFQDGRIYTPEGTGYTPGEILSITWLDQSIRTLRAELYQKTGQYYDQDYYHGYHVRERKSLKEPIFEREHDDQPVPTEP